MNSAGKLVALRRSMAEAGLDAYVDTGADPHASEYPPSMWRTRRWLTGFTGSAGTVAVTSDRAGLWTDYRYWLQAPAELEGSGIDLFREGGEGVADLPDWLAANLPAGAVVGIDGRTVTEKTASEWESVLGRAGIALVDNADLIGCIWEGRPGLPEPKTVELGTDEAGETRADKVARLRTALESAGADTWVGVGLDAAAWLLNVRGADVPYNPVVIGFLLLTPAGITWFTHSERIPGEIRESLENSGVSLAPYGDFFAALSSLPSGVRVYADPTAVSRAVFRALPKGAVIRTGADPVAALKSRKNDVEIARIMHAMEKDGAAVVRFLCRLDHLLSAGRTISEIEAADMLRSCRAEMTGFLGDSFSSIPALDAHGAICHYEPREEGAFMLGGGAGLFLIDSGGQWKEGTTDITRTVSLGCPAQRQREDYTLVLKAHIAVATARFPKGTRGYQVDALARAGLWRRGMDYGHGTGHGVGYRLNVHEGPQRLSPHPIDVALEPGMIVSDEPGLYREGEHGVRIENLVLCREVGTTEFGTFLGFETLTLAPYDARLIETGMLDTGEKAWIDGYHEEVRRRLEPLLDGEESDWLRRATEPLP